MSTETEKGTIGPEHLGDGVYAQASHGRIVLTTCAHYDSAMWEHVVFLDPTVLEFLESYIKRARESGALPQ